MNLADYLVLGLVIVASFRGWRLGFLGQAFEIGGGFLGLVAGLLLAPRIANAATEKPGLEGVLIGLVVVFVCLSVGQTGGYFVGHRFGSLAKQKRLGGWDHGVGAGFGIVVMLASYWLVGSLLVQGPSRAVARTVRQSVLLRALNKVATPPDVLAQLRHYLDTSGFPQVFVGLPRPVGPPVDLPSDAEARRAVEAADQSTVRILVRACDATSLGSGWVAGDDLVVTNAHVVAGGSEFVVEDGAGRHTGSVVVFNPRADIAVIRVDGLGGPPLDIETDVLSRGDVGATLGYPGSARGELVTHRAAIAAQFNALGRDIYGRREVTREVYELRAAVRQGDSGGPFVLPSGDVAGMIFAASTTNGDTGYALVGTEFADEVDTARTRGEPVGTGGCTR